MKKVVSIILTLVMVLTTFAEFGTVTFASNDGGAAMVSCGDAHTGILKKDGSLWMICL